jgi:hypothetical protein
VPSVSVPKSPSVPSIPTVPAPSASGGASGGGGGGVAKAASVAAAATASSGFIGSAESRGLSDRANSERLGLGTTINLTVTGAFDKEGTARTIVDTLNNSFYRGTGGGNNLQLT